jgi:glyoxylase-like metal-dependent hydrolase (beta-lactamase superfamily II)
MHPRLLPTTLIAAAALIMTTAGAAPPLTPEPAPIRSGWTAQQAPGFYRLRLGDFRITVVSDGTAARDLSAIMSDPAKVRQAYADSHEGLPAELSINCYVIETGTQTILVDTGAGELFGATGGHLVENLRAAGYAPEDIDAVLLTHIHADHSGGLSIGGKRVFPNALVYVDQRDPAYWLDPQHETQAPADKRLSFQQSRQTVGPYLADGKLRTFDGAQQLFDGVRSVSLHGHTPGMSGYMVESRGQRLLLWGDIVHAAQAQFATPALSIDYDVKAPAAVATRQRILADAAAQGYLIGGAHLSFPGLGHVAGSQGVYRWIPKSYIAAP